MLFLELKEFNELTKAQKIKIKYFFEESNIDFNKIKSDSIVVVKYFPQNAEKIIDLLKRKKFVETFEKKLKNKEFRKSETSLKITKMIELFFDNKFVKIVDGREVEHNFEKRNNFTFSNFQEAKESFKFPKNKIFNQEQFRDYFVGGIQYRNQNKKIFRNVKKYDFNAFYSKVLKEQNFFPTRLVSKKPNKKLLDQSKLFYVAKAKIKFIGIKKINYLNVEMNRVVDVFFNTIEWKNIKDNYVFELKKIKSMYVFEQEKVDLSENINKLYSDKFFNRNSKIALNSIIGILGKKQKDKSNYSKTQNVIWAIKIVSQARKEILELANHNKNKLVAIEVDAIYLSDKISFNVSKKHGSLKLQKTYKAIWNGDKYLQKVTSDGELKRIWEK